MCTQPDTDTQIGLRALGECGRNFRVDHPERYAGKHILLVDDVLTTGSTVTACADAFAGVEDLRISVLTLAKAAI